ALRFVRHDNIYMLHSASAKEPSCSTCERAGSIFLECQSVALQSFAGINSKCLLVQLAIAPVPQDGLPSQSAPLQYDDWPPRFAPPTVQHCAPEQAQKPSRSTHVPPFRAARGLPMHRV